MSEGSAAAGWQAAVQCTHLLTEGVDDVVVVRCSLFVVHRSLFVQTFQALSLLPQCLPSFLPSFLLSVGRHDGVGPRRAVWGGHCWCEATAVVGLWRNETCGSVTGHRIALRCMHLRLNVVLVE